MLNEFSSNISGFHCQAHFKVIDVNLKVVVALEKVVEIEEAVNIFPFYKLEIERLSTLPKGIQVFVYMTESATTWRM